MSLLFILICIRYVQGFFCISADHFSVLTVYFLLSVYASRLLRFFLSAFAGVTRGSIFAGFFVCDLPGGVSSRCFVLVPSSSHFS